MPTVLVVVALAVLFLVLFFLAGLLVFGLRQFLLVGVPFATLVFVLFFFAGLLVFGLGRFLLVGIALLHFRASLELANDPRVRLDLGMHRVVFVQEIDETDDAQHARRHDRSGGDPGWTAACDFAAERLKARVAQAAFGRAGAKEAADAARQKKQRERRQGQECRPHEQQTGMFADIEHQLIL